MARQRFGNLTEDRARMMLFNGEPKDVLRTTCEVLLPIEIWSFSGTEPVRGEFTLVFVSRGGAQGPYRLWAPADGIETILSLGMQGHVDSTERGLAAIAELCPRGEDIAARLGEALDWRRVETTVHLMPHPSDEWLSTFASYSTDVPEGAAAFPARLDLSFPARFGSRTVVQGLVLGAARRRDAREAGRRPRGLLQLPGRRRGAAQGRAVRALPLPLHPARQRGDDLPEIPVVFQRNLRPGTYGLILKIEDTAGKRYYREQREIEVPTVDSSAPPPQQAIAAVGRPARRRRRPSRRPRSRRPTRASPRAIRRSASCRPPTAWSPASCGWRR